jgi:hypothetical protein
MKPTIYNKNTLVLAAVAATLGFMLVSGVMVQYAFAHANTTLTLTQEPVAGKKVRVTVGHTNEPTFGATPGIHDGKHNFEVLLADSDTRLPLTGASLKVDKYYFKDIRSFNKAKGLNDADEIEKGVTVGAVFGDPGHYMARQVQKEGIYGYRLYGTISYFGEATMNIDSTVFCSSAEGDTKKFNNAGWSGSFGCTDDIADIAFPEKNADIRRASSEIDANGSAQVQQIGLGSDGSTAGTQSAVAAASGFTIQVPAASLPAAALQVLMVGIPAAGLATFFGVRTFKNRRNDRSL